MSLSCILLSWLSVEILSEGVISTQTLRENMEP
jgi:hypothetical protein